MSNQTLFVLFDDEAIAFSSSCFCGAFVLANSMKAYLSNNHISSDSGVQRIRVVVQNLQKTDGLASKLLEERPCAVMLAQEISALSEHLPFVSHTSKRGYGTAIFVSKELRLENVRKVQSPHAELGGFIVKKSIVASCVFPGNATKIELISFHGYNGWPVFRDAAYLIDHVRAVLDVVTPNVPALFCGDFNSWTQEHLDGVEKVMREKGFERIFSWPYPGRDFPLDHAFGRMIKLDSSEIFESPADHRGADLRVTVLKNAE